MRIALASLIALSLACAGCGRTEIVVTPLAEARDQLADNFWGDVLLKDGGRLRVIGGRRLGDWICGRAAGVPSEGEVCVEASRVTAVAASRRVYGPGDRVAQGFGVVVMAPVAAVWWYFSDRQQRQSRSSSPSPPPPPMTEAERQRQSALQALASCAHVPWSDRDEVDGDDLAQEIWRDRGSCIDAASTWYLTTGDLQRGRRLALIGLARMRYEELACGLPDPGLNAPRPEAVNGAGERWMGEYRAVVADVRTYDYDIVDRCPPSQGAGGREPPAPSALAAARARAVGDFPLTDPRRLAAALARSELVVGVPASTANTQQD